MSIRWRRTITAATACRWMESTRRLFALWGYGNMFWYMFGKNQDRADLRSRDRTAYTENVMLTSLDGQFDYVETYGTNNTVGNEYGHVYGIIWGGGQQFTGSRLLAGG